MPEENILLSESTNAELLDELAQRFSAFIFGGLELRTNKDGIQEQAFVKHGHYTIRQGLLAILTTATSYENEDIAESVYYAMEGLDNEFDDDDDNEFDEDDSGDEPGEEWKKDM